MNYNEARANSEIIWEEVFCPVNLDLTEWTWPSGGGRGYDRVLEKKIINCCKDIFGHVTFPLKYPLMIHIERINTKTSYDIEKKDYDSLEDKNLDFYKSCPIKLRIFEMGMEKISQDYKSNQLESAKAFAVNYLISFLRFEDLPAGNI